MIPTIAWQDGIIRLLDQTRLPAEEIYLEIGDLESLAEAIYHLRIRGAPAIGIAGAYGMALVAEQSETEQQVAAGAAQLRAVRPTAVNLAWAVDQCLARYRAVRAAGGASREAAAAVLAAATRIHEEDLESSRAMGRAGAALLPSDARVLTHCNTGGLATGGLGTALAVVFEAARQGKAPHVYAAETRPLWQGARLTAWELAREQIPVTVLVDGARAHLMATQRLDAVLVGADRVAANGDAANKIGTLGGAILAAHFDVPFYVVAPRSTFDFAIAAGPEIPVEERDGGEIKRCGPLQLVPDQAGTWNPAFDVTPAALITGWITDHGVLQPPFDELR